MFRRILVASDLTDGSRAALRLALHLGCQLGASVVALHVIEDAADPGEQTIPRFDAGDGDDTARLQHAEAEARARLEKETRNAMPPRPARLPVQETIVRSGSPAETIVSTAQAGEADLVVVGAGGDPGDGDGDGEEHGAGATLGSVALHVVSHAGRPVLAVPAERDVHDQTDIEIHDADAAHDRL